MDAIHTSTPITRSPAEKRAIEEAAAWYARLCADDVTLIEQQDWRRWLAAHTLHRDAWSRVEAMQRRFGAVPAALAAPALNAGIKAEVGARRTLLRGVVVLFGAGTLSWIGWKQPVRKEWMADLRTGVGERRDVTLADGSRLSLNTRTSVDVAFSATQRLLQLRAGEIIVQTAPDPTLSKTEAARPFLVETVHGRIHALGTRFLVRTDDNGTRVTVIEKAVQVYAIDADGQTRAPILLKAGEQLLFGPNDSEAGIKAAAIGADAWQQGNLIADNMPLAHLLTEIARYRRGLVNCDPSIAGLLISGTFPISDTDRALQVLINGFPLRVEFRTRYWARVLPI